jgi:dihydroneopterin triphosphate diphosphatase
MTRAPFQVLIYPYRRIQEDRFEYAIFKRADEGFWQGISGGGEDGESPLEAARREAFEEAGLAPDLDFLQSFFNVGSRAVDQLIFV